MKSAEQIYHEMVGACGWVCRRSPPCKGACNNRIDLIRATQIEALEKAEYVIISRINSAAFTREQRAVADTLGEILDAIRVLKPQEPK